MLSYPCGFLNIQSPATLTTNNGSDCIPFLYDDEPIYADRKNSKGDIEITMKFWHGVACNANQNYTMTLILTCDQKVNPFDVKFSVSSSSTPCDIIITAESSNACPLFSLGWMMGQYFSIFTLVFLLLGVFLTFYGHLFFKYVLFIFGAVTVFSIVLVNPYFYIYIFNRFLSIRSFYLLPLLNIISG